MRDKQKLISLAEYKKLDPYQKGYASYMQAALPDSEISDVNPYRPRTADYHNFQRGQNAAVLEVQDLDD